MTTTERTSETQGAGHYSIEARQSVKNRNVVVASTYFDV